MTARLTASYYPADTSLSVWDMTTGDALRRAADLYPGNAMAHAELAWALHVAGQDLPAAKSATEALRLDRMNPHQELRLGSRRLFDEPAGGSLTSGMEEVPAGGSAEQYMEALSHSE